VKMTSPHESGKDSGGGESNGMTCVHGKTPRRAEASSLGGTTMEESAQSRGAAKEQDPGTRFPPKFQVPGIC
jgi:hypothetical protein